MLLKSVITPKYYTFKLRNYASKKHNYTCFWIYLVLFLDFLVTFLDFLAGPPGQDSRLFSPDKNNFSGVGWVQVVHPEG
jgi:hypothetical protein